MVWKVDSEDRLFEYNHKEDHYSNFERWCKRRFDNGTRGSGPRQRQKQRQDR